MGAVRAFCAGWRAAQASTATRSAGCRGERARLECTGRGGDDAHRPRHTSRSEDEPLEELASLGIELPQAALVIASPDPLPPPLLDEEAIDDSETTEASGDTHGHAQMFGRYLGQISARIERAWLRPRSPISAPRFSCQTKIEQDQDGKVLSIELRHCNGDARWQRSLVSAIEHASPLPAPPTPSVFARMLVLNFSADAFQAGISNARRYEPEIRLAATTAA